MRKQAIKSLLMMLFVSILIQGCKKDNSIDLPEEEVSTLSDVPEGYFESETRAEGFPDRINYSNEVVIWNSLNPFNSGDVDTRTGDEYDDIFWLHVADIEPYVLFGETLSATHIDFIDNKAYISYHKRGAQHLGAIEVVDLTNPEEPVVTFRGYLSAADVNAITVGTDPVSGDINAWLSLSDSKKGAVLGEVKLSDGTNYNGFKMVNLSNFIDGGITSSANSVCEIENYLYISSGKTHGGVFCLNTADLSMVGVSEFENGKYISPNGNNLTADMVVSLQTGEQATLRTESIGGAGFATEYNIGTILHQNVDVVGRGKSTLHFVDNNQDEAYVTMGMEGLKRFNIHTGELTWSSPTDMITSGNTNGLTSDGEFIYVANGADGLTVFTQPEIGEIPERVFQWDLDDAETASANMVETYGEWIFVAKGQGGVKILKRPQSGDYLPIDSYNDLGVPDNLGEDQESCPTLISTIFQEYLPNGQNAKQAHPEFFASNVPSSILITEDADISITFLSEGAGYKNVLGYYYYNADNPPTSAEEISKLIVFPNASAEGSGGGLIEGNTVNLVGNFQANTVLGFFLNADGWSNGTITEGNWAHYTDYEFNLNNKRQSVLMYSPECDATVIGFEDIYVPQSDKDFNDALFQIRSYPNNAYDVNSLIQLD